MAKKSAAQVGALHGFRSGLEDVNARFLTEWNVTVEYEQYDLTYVKPAREARYTPDFILPNGIIVETKGRFLTEDRQKHILIKKQYPQLDLRFVFSNPNTRISKQSKTTYAIWCQSHGFLYASKVIPQEWLAAPNDPVRLEALSQILRKKPAKKGTSK
ncbi:endodeoxyribonuclease [Sinorhizobium meliloti]|uniref:endodeoxyribonuclease n=1 Tax=Rhizobium meliloti TaxID=382 RepID=UPI000FD6C671|nr:endodeoxyribonuclease [Sinorhizobium meliloti]RVG38003.1 endodeoxyribonuclease [Sinorhizobium meliloti]